MIPRYMAVLVIVAGMIGGGCSTGNPGAAGRWAARPGIVRVDTPTARASLTPRQGEFDYFTAFELTVVNTGSDELAIDWNASRYEYNGSPQGPLVFQGIDPAAVKTATVPPDVVPPGGVFSRRVMPMRTIAWSPVREKTPNRPAITAGMLPAGANGIRLVLRHAKGETVLPLVVRILREG